MKALRAALWLIEDVALPYHRRHVARAALTLLGVAIGCAIVVAVELLNRSVVGSFRETVETIAGSADLQVTNPGAGVPEVLLEAIPEIPGITSAAGLLQATLPTPRGELTIFGVDVFGDQVVRARQFPPEAVTIPDEFAFTNALDSVALSTALLERWDLAPEAAIEVAAPAGRRVLRVRGTVEPRGPAALYDGAVALLDLPAAQQLLGRVGLLDQIDIVLAEDAEPVVVRAALERVVAGRARVHAPRERATGLDGMLLNLRTFLSLVSLEAIVVGIFLVHHALATAIAHRRRELAICRAVGFAPRALALAVALEALAFGLVGAVVGCGLGVGLAELALDAVRGAVGAIYARSGAGSLELGVRQVMLALLLGVGTALAAAVAPARSAARVPVLRHLRRDDGDGREGAPRLRAMVVAGAALIGLGTAGFFIEYRSTSALVHLFLMAVPAALLALGFALIVPAALAGFVALLRKLVGERAPITVQLALESLARDPVRRRGPLTPMLVAFALVLLGASMVASLRASILGWVERTLAADLYVVAGPSLPLPSGETFPAALEARVVPIDGVAKVAASRLVYTQLGERTVVLRSLRGRLPFDGLDYPVREALPDAAESFARGEAVLVSDDLAHREGLRAGDTIELATASGPRRFTVGALVVDFTLDVGTITLEEATYRRFWKDDLANVLYVWTESGVAVPAVRRAIEQALEPVAKTSILTAGQFERDVSGALDGALRLTWAIELVALGIALIGVVNFFLVEVSDRRREMGLLRAVAFGPRALGRSLLTEAALLGLLGGLLGVAYGGLVSWLVVSRSARLVSGWSLDFVFPLGLAATTVVVATVAAVLAARFPVRRASARAVAELVSME